jgi:hypothetical protein
MRLAQARRQEGLTMKRGRKGWALLAIPVAFAAVLWSGCSSEQAAADEDEIVAPESQVKGEEEGSGVLSKLGLAKPEPKPVVVPAGTRIQVRTTSTLSTKSNTAGESFVATVAEPVSVDGKTVFPAGARAVGVLSSVDKGGRIKGVASLGAQLTEIEDVAVDTKSYVAVAKKTHGKDATKIGIGAGVGAAIGAIAGGGDGAAKGAGAGAGAGTGAVLATRGDPAVIPAESLIWFELQSAVTVQ